MKKYIQNKPIIFLIAGVLLFTFCAAPAAHAAVFLVPAVGLALWGAITAAAGISAAVDAADDQKPGKMEQSKTNVLDQKAKSDKTSLAFETQKSAG